MIVNQCATMLCRLFQRLLVAAALSAITATADAGEPSDLPGLVLWLEASANLVTTDADQLVSEWRSRAKGDRAASIRSVVQPETARQPQWVDNAIGTRPALRFTGTTWLHNETENLVAAGKPRTVFVVGQLDSDAAGGSVLAFRRSASDDAPLFGVNLFAAQSGTTDAPSTSFLVYTDGWHGESNASIEGASDALATIRKPFVSMHQSTGAGNTIEVAINGVGRVINAVVPVRTEGGLTGFTVGGSENAPDDAWRGAIAEVLVYDRALTVEERKQVHDYLLAKYQIEPKIASAPVLAGRKQPTKPTEPSTETLARAITIENAGLLAKFDRNTGSLIQLTNKLTDETFDVWGDEFAVVAEEFTLEQSAMRLVELAQPAPDKLVAKYAAEGHHVEVEYRLPATGHFLEKQITLKSSQPYGFAELVISRPGIGGVPLQFTKYSHLKTDTYFGRTARGTVFVGVEKPFDSAAILAQNQVSLGYEPNMKVAAEQPVVCEPIYIGVCRKSPHDGEASALPLPSESDAMVAMTTAIIAPKTPRLHPNVCGWWSEFTREPYATPADVQHDMRCIDMAIACGIDLVLDGRPWAGELAKVDALRDDDKLQLSEQVLKVADYARQKNVRWVFWSSMNVSDPTYLHKQVPYRADRPDWLMPPHHANNIGYKPFFDWWLKLNLDTMDAGNYAGWAMDGDFFGTGGYTKRVDCPLTTQDHIRGDVTYLCERNLLEAARALRERDPNTYIFHCRPAMDLGVWSLRYSDTSFTIDEHARETGLPGMGPQPTNVLLGDKIRAWARVRLHHHFFPHVMDSPQLFGYPKSLWPEAKPWMSDRLDYILISALSCAPSQTFYLPCATGIPAADQKQIKKWLDWGRENIDYMWVRKDLPDWPAVGKVDGSAHIIADRGYVFLFNPNSTPLDASFNLDDSIGLTEGQKYRVSQYYPPRGKSRNNLRDQSVTWTLPPQTACILKIEPSEVREN
jgi:hypothetical protein